MFDLIDNVHMKKAAFLVTVLLLISIFMPIAAQAAIVNVDFEITNYHIDAYVESDGAMRVEELLTYDGSFHGQEWNLQYATGRNTPKTVSDLSDLEGDARIYDAQSVSDIRVYVLIDPDGGTGESNLVEYMPALSGAGEMGDSGIYERRSESNTLFLKIFSLTQNERRAILITYRLKDVAVMHQDVAEVYWNFIGERWEEPLNDVEINIHLPRASEELRVFAHGPLGGVSEIVSDSQVRLSVDRMSAGVPLDGRVVFTKDVLDSCEKTTAFEALPEILRIEEERADGANSRRGIAQVLHYLVLALTLIGLAGMVWAGIHIYFKYYKPKTPTFRGKYYRELPAEYSPAVMTYNLHNEEIYPRDLTASILDMIRKKVFILDIQSIEKKRILLGSKTEEEYLITDNSKNLQRPLTSYEEFIRHWLIEKIGDGRSTSFNSIEAYSKDKETGKEFYRDYGLWMNMVQQEAQGYAFFDDKAYDGVALGVLLSLVSMGVGVLAIFMGIMIGIANIPVGIGLLIYSLRIKKRSKQGYEDYVKWKAFSRFLIDFSKLDDAVVPSIAVWEHYLVYAVSLGIADKVIETMQTELKPSSFENLQGTFLRGIYVYGGFAAIRNLNSSFSIMTNNALESAISQKSSGSGLGGGFSMGGGSGGGGGTGGGGF